MPIWPRAISGISPTVNAMTTPTASADRTSRFLKIALIIS
jgi:hypothetical protein